MNVAQWITTHQKQAAIGGGAVAVGGFALYRKQKAAAASTATTSGAVSTTPAAGTTGSTGYDSSANDVYNSVEGVLEQLQTTVAGLNAPGGLATATPVTTLPSEPFAVDGRLFPNGTSAGPITGGVGGGVGDLGTLLGLTGGIPVPAAPTPTPVAAPIPMPAATAPAASTYTHVANPTALKALPAGTNLYTVKNGVYSLIPNPTALKALPSGTAIYTKAG